MSGQSEHVDVVVVGSGFGGSVTAYRMAQDGRSVVVLERGRAYPPGSFARTPRQMSQNFWDPSEGHHGLFDIWTFRGMEGVVSSGLGGGSLIYANVLLRKDEHWFVHESPLPGGGYEHWPVSRAQLDPHYDEVERMIGVSPYPYPATAKTVAMRESADVHGLEFMLPPLAISFARREGETPVPGAELPPADYPNIHGRPRLTCRLCGECDLGCNDGAKNTLDHTYLSAAADLGADIRTRHEVRGFRPRDGGGYEVTYVVHGAEPGVPSADLPTRTITCERLVLAAGTFGSTYLLLRNVTSLPAMSTTALGTRFSGNGDLLTFLLGAKEGDEPRVLDASRGPVITSAIRVGDSADGDGSTGRGHYVEDAGYPFFTEWLLETAQVGQTAKRAGRFALQRIRNRVTDSSDSSIGADMAELLGGGALSGSSMPLLGMGRDVADGVMQLRDGRLAVDWTTETSREYFEGVRGTMRQIADHLSADYHDNPMWITRRVVTVHPLGGSPMGRHPQEGVCDEYGEVFGHPGLHVLDGALMPGPVGANPSLTIAAMADRACTRIVETSPRGSTLSQVPLPRVEPPLVDLPPAAGGAGTRVSFTEQMKGFVGLGATDPQEGHDLGRRNGDRLMFELTITTDDVDRFVAEPDHEGSAVGYLHSDVLGGRFEVEQGWFNLFVEEDDPTTRRMLYRLWFRGPAGNPLTFSGHKLVHDDPGPDVWRDTSTLFVRIFDGHLGPGDDDGEVVAAGIITIHVPDFLRQLTTFRSRGDRRIHGLEEFGRLFLGQLWEVYRGSVSRDSEPVP